MRFIVNKNKLENRLKYAIKDFQRFSISDKCTCLVDIIFKPVWRYIHGSIVICHLFFCCFFSIWTAILFLW